MMLLTDYPEGAMHFLLLHQWLFCMMEYPRGVSSSEIIDNLMSKCLVPMIISVILAMTISDLESGDGLIT